MTNAVGKDYEIIFGDLVGSTGVLQSSGRQQYELLIADFVSVLAGLATAINSHPNIIGDPQGLAGFFPHSGDSFVCLIPVFCDPNSTECSKRLVVKVLLETLVEWGRQNRWKNYVAMGIHTTTQPLLTPAATLSGLGPRYNFVPSMDFAIAKRLETASRSCLSNIMFSQNFYNTYFADAGQHYAGLLQGNFNRIQFLTDPLYQEYAASLGAVGQSVGYELVPPLP